MTRSGIRFPARTITHSLKSFMILPNFGRASDDVHCDRESVA